MGLAVTLGRTPIYSRELVRRFSHGKRETRRSAPRKINKCCVVAQLGTGLLADAGPRNLARPRIPVPEFGPCSSQKRPRRRTCCSRSSYVMSLT